MKISLAFVVSSFGTLIYAWILFYNSNYFRLSIFFNGFPEQIVEKKKFDFNGKVLIVGAGAAGLAAANVLEDNGIDYQIIEATNRFGGRIEKSDNFSDLPIDLGAEWIHHKPDILNKLKAEKENHLEARLIKYQVLNTYKWTADQLSKISTLFLKLRYWILPEYKFKDSTWYDFLDENFAQKVKNKIVYSSPVVGIDYSDDTVFVTTQSNEVFVADKVIISVPIGVLRSEMIRFVPDLPNQKREAINSVEFHPGFKLIMKFSEKFYPDMTLCDTTVGEKSFYDVMYQKPTEEAVLGLLVMGSSAKDYYDLGSRESILDAALSELDIMFDGKASLLFTGEYIFKDWGRHPYTLGTWTHDLKSKSIDLNTPLQNKVYFAGEAHDIHGQYSTVHGAIISGYSTVYELLK